MSLPSAPIPPPLPPVPSSPVPQQRPPTSTTKILIIVTVVVGAFLAASTIGKTALTRLIYTGMDKAIEKVTEVPDKRDVTVGEPFTLAGFAVAAGWQVAKTPQGTLTITGLRVTYTEHYPRMPHQRYFFSKDGVVVAEVSCGLYEDLEHGQTVTMECQPDPVRFPRDYDRVQVRDTY